MEKALTIVPHNIIYPGRPETEINSEQTQ